MQTFEFQVKDSVKCGGCNWETSRLYVGAESKEEAGRLLHNAYGCSGCGKLEWEHGTLHGFFGEKRETAEPIYSGGVDGACDDFSPNSETGIDGGGLCGDCYAKMQAELRSEGGVMSFADTRPALVTCAGCNKPIQLIEFVPKGEVWHSEGYVAFCSEGCILDLACV